MPTGHLVRTYRSSSTHMFQSLFFWMMPTGCRGLCNSQRPHKFQSLFFWMMPTGYYRRRNDPVESEFQSLFFWMMPTGRDSLWANLWWFSGFNPCSSGWCLPAGDYYGNCAPNLCFNPCSSGWCLPAHAARRSELPNGCFNPCSSGWCLPALIILTYYYIYFLFQSLFFWMMPTGDHRCPGLIETELGFNPCSSGWCLPAWDGRWSTQFH